MSSLCPAPPPPPRYKEENHRIVTTVIRSLTTAGLTYWVDFATLLTVLRKEPLLDWDQVSAMHKAVHDVCHVGPRVPYYAVVCQSARGLSWLGRAPTCPLRPPPTFRTRTLAWTCLGTWTLLPLWTSWTAKLGSRRTLTKVGH